MAGPLPRPLISAVSNRRLLGAHDGDACAQLIEWSAAVAGAGVDILQIRERELSDASLAQLVRGVLSAVSGTGVRVVVNDRIDVAIAAGAAGVHLPSSAPAAARVRRLVPSGFLIGRSVHAGDDLGALERAGGCDYLTFGTVFRSGGKPPDHQPAGIESLRRACAATRLPVLAIGGITVAVAAEVTAAGAAGVAAIGLFLDSWRPGAHGEGPAAQLAAVVAALRARLMPDTWDA